MRGAMRPCRESEAGVHGRVSHSGRHRHDGSHDGRRGQYRPHRWFPLAAVSDGQSHHHQRPGRSGQGRQHHDRSPVRHPRSQPGPRRRLRRTRGQHRHRGGRLPGLRERYQRVLSSQHLRGDQYSGPDHRPQRERGSVAGRAIAGGDASASLVCGTGRCRQSEQPGRCGTRGPAARAGRIPAEPVARAGAGRRRAFQERGASLGDVPPDLEVSADSHVPEVSGGARSSSACS